MVAMVAMVANRPLSGNNPRLFSNKGRLFSNNPRLLRNKAGLFITFNTRDARSLEISLYLCSVK